MEMTHARATRASRKVLLGLVASKRKEGFTPSDLLDDIKTALTSRDPDLRQSGRESALHYLVPHRGFRQW